MRAQGSWFEAGPDHTLSASSGTENRESMDIVED